MDVFFRRKASGSESKTQVAAELQVDGGYYAFSAGMELGINSARSDSKTEINVNYFGANNNNWISGLDMDALKQAVIDFPENCVGNVADYILWPYENIQSFQGVVTMIKFAKANNQPTPIDPFSLLQHDATPQSILSNLFTQAIIEVKIIQNTLE
jgi:hypothetical protein